MHLSSNQVVISLFTGYIALGLNWLVKKLRLLILSERAKIIAAHVHEAHKPRLKTCQEGSCVKL